MTGGLLLWIFSGISLESVRINDLASKSFHPSNWSYVFPHEETEGDDPRWAGARALRGAPVMVVLPSVATRPLGP